MAFSMVMVLRMQKIRHYGFWPGSLDALRGATEHLAYVLERKALAISELDQVHVFVVKVAEALADGFGASINMLEHLWRFGLQHVENLIGELNVRGCEFLPVVEHLVSGDGDPQATKSLPGRYSSKRRHMTMVVSWRRSSASV